MGEMVLGTSQRLVVLPEDRLDPLTCGVPVERRIPFHLRADPDRRFETPCHPLDVITTKTLAETLRDQ